MRDIVNFEDDFGFSAISEDELVKREQEAALAAEQAATIKAKQEAELNTTAATQAYEEKLLNMYSAIMPLLNNLAKDENKEYIYWPNRKEKIDKFIAKIKSIME